MAYRREDGCQILQTNNYLRYSTFVPKSGPSPSRVCCIFAQLTDNNVLGKIHIYP